MDDNDEQAALEALLAAARAYRRVCVEYDWHAYGPHMPAPVAEAKRAAIERLLLAADAWADEAGDAP